jgi:hypothetical protein
MGKRHSQIAAIPDRNYDEKTFPSHSAFLVFAVRSRDQPALCHKCLAGVELETCEGGATQHSRFACGITGIERVELIPWLFRVVACM